MAITSDAGADLTYALGDEIEVRVDFSEPVVAVHNPELQLNLGITSAATGTVPAILAGGERTTSLTFRYRVREGDLDTDGVSIGTDALAQGNVEDLAGNPAQADQPDLALDNQPAHRVDAVATGAATVAVVSSAGADNTYALGDLIEVQVQFAAGDEVVVSGPVELVLSFGANDSPPSNLKRRASLVRQTARHLTFHYRVQAGDLDEDGLGVDRNALVGGTVVDEFGNPARLLVPFVDDANMHLVDGVQPEVAGMQIVSVPNDGDTYGLGEDIEVEVSFSEVVHTNQELTLIVQIGGQTRHAAFVDGSGTRTLLLRYTVVSSDRDDDGISVPGSALSCPQEPSACIWDNGGNPTTEPTDGLAAQPGAQGRWAARGAEAVHSVRALERQYLRRGASASRSSSVFRRPSTLGGCRSWCWRSEAPSARRRSPAATGRGACSSNTPCAPGTKTPTGSASDRGPGRCRAVRSWTVTAIPCPSSSRASNLRPATASTASHPRRSPRRSSRPHRKGSTATATRSASR